MPPISTTICGIAWPGDKPGFAAVVELVGRRMYLRHEIEGTTLDELISECMIFTKVPRAKVSTTYRGIVGFVGRNDPDAMQFISDWNYDDKKPWIEFGTAPAMKKTGHIYYHTQLIFELTDPDKKRLWLIPETDGPCKLRAYIDEIPETGIQKMTDIEFPGVAALGYACAYLEEIKKELYSGMVDSHNDIKANQNRSSVTGY